MAEWGAALQSGVDGYLRGLQIAKLGREQEEADQLKADLKDAGKQIAVEQIGGQQQLPSWADNRDAGSAEMQALPNSGLVTTPMALQVAGKTYGTRAEADAAAAAANSPTAMAQRAAAVYSKHGQADKAIAMQQQAISMERQQAEMAETAARLKKAGVMDALQKFRMFGDPAAAKTALAGAGFAVSGDVSVEPVVLDVPGLGKVKTFKASFGLKDGDKEVPASIDAHQASAAMLPYEQVLELQRQGEVDRRNQQNADRTFNEGKRQFDVTNARLSAGQAQESELRKLQIGKVKLELEEAARNAKISPADKLRAEGIRKEMETVGAAVVKAQADGSWQPDSPGAKELMARQGTLRKQLEDILLPYQKSEGARPAFGGLPSSSAASPEPQSRAAPKAGGASPQGTAPAARPGTAIAAEVHQADPMEQLYRKEVAEMNRGLRTDLGSDVKDWLARRDDEKKQRFNAAHAAYLQKEKDRALRESKVLAANSRP